jgi:ATP-binding cassette subfamily G (WHITE) protein 1
MTIFNASDSAEYSESSFAAGNSEVAINIRNSVIVRSTEASQIVFKDLTFTVPLKPIKGSKKAEEKTILRQISGVFKPGRMTAIMGASGAGKTSLLNVLSGEMSTGSLQGDVLVNSEPMTGSKMMKISGFVFQDDVMLATMTPREAISMSALLRLPKSVSAEEKMERVEDVIQILHLNKAADTVVGSVLVKGISGGERKRASVAMELVTNPSILFLDEPTSGLDTFTAYRVMETLSDLARHGRTVVATIHQPSSEIFYLFDDLILLSEGEIIYSGPVVDAVPYFARHGYQCPTFNNPADYIFMNILKDNDDKTRSEEKNTKEAALEASPVLVPEKHSELKRKPRHPYGSTEKSETAANRLIRLKAAWKESEENKELMSIVNEPAKGGVALSSMKHQSSFTVQCRYLLGRAMKNVLRNKMAFQIRLAQSLVIGLLIGLIYRDVSSRPYRSQIQDREGSLFFVTVNMFMSSVMTILTIFFDEKLVFVREYRAGYYGLFAYFITKLAVELPFYIFYPFLTTVVSYFLVGYQTTAGKFFIVAFINVLSANTGLALGLLTSCIFNNLAVALGIVPLIILPLMIFSGLFVNGGSLPVYFAWIKYISPMKYAFSALIQNEFDGLQLNNCTGPGTSSCSGYVAIEELNMQNDFNIFENILMQILFYVIYVVLAYGALYYVTRRKKKH